ncbi:MAG: AAA family ATPase, partial [Minisyncoccia bacterium]
MKEIFGVEPHLMYTKDNSLRITYHSKFLGDFFETHCGNGSHNKHIPEFLWDLPSEYFLSYLDGFRKEDGCTSQEGKLIVASTSKQLILELTWLSAMHGIKVGVKKAKFKGGRIIKNKPLPEREYWVLIIGKTSHPFEKSKNSPYQFKKPIIRKIIKKPYNNFVYDLCGCENEAFFGGEKPILLHNSRVRSLFSQARKVRKAIIFIDEIDSIGKIRGVGITGGHEEREQTLNQLLAEMDGIGSEEGILVFAASVTGDTQVLIKKGGQYKLLPISEVIDPYYPEGTEKIEILAEDLEVLGFEKKEIEDSAPKNNIYFGNSSFKKIRSVYRHKVNEIYEIEYLGGKIRATENHSVFVRTQWGLKTKAVKDLKPGDILVDLPFKVNRGIKEKREIRAHKFNPAFNLELSVWEPVFEKFETVKSNYQYVLAQVGKISKTSLGKIFGVDLSTIRRWQNGLSLPRVLSRNYYQHKDILPEKVRVTPDLMRLFGYYVAEGYSRKGVDFCLNKNEKEKIEDIKKLMKEIFNLEPNEEKFITPGAINICYYSTPVGKFFAYHCGKGAENKHVPNFLFEAPFEYFKEFFKGYFGGDGSMDKR